MGREYDTIVLGLGAMGSAAAFHLAQRRVRVLGIEQFSIAHDRGSSHGRSRMIRLVYYEHPDYVPLLRRAYELWDELEQHSGRKLLHRTGGIYLGRPGAELIDGALRSAREHSLPHELLDRDEIVRRFPQFAPPADAVALYEPAAGFLLPEEVIRTHIELARRSGGEIRDNEKVLNWSADSTGVVVTTDRAEYRARTLILAAGAWLPKLAAELSRHLNVTRQIIAWFQPRDPTPFALGRFPVWAIDYPAGGLHYGFPIHDDAGLKCGLHFPAAAADPDRLDRTLYDDDIVAIRDTVNEWIPGACEHLRSHATCMYTNSPDGHFIVDRHPRHENVLVASCCSGHGFKFASVIGEVLADLSTSGNTAQPIQLFRVQRFGTQENMDRHG